MRVQAECKTGGAIVSDPEAERYILKWGTLIKLPRGHWRAWLRRRPLSDRSLPAVPLIRTYGSTREDALIEAAYELKRWWQANREVRS